MNASSHLHPLSSAARAALLSVMALSCCLSAMAQQTLHTWTGPATGNWTDTSGWDTGVVPRGDTADVLIDGNIGQNSAVTFSLSVTNVWTNGYVTVSAGDMLHLTKVRNSSATVYLSGITNLGTLRVTAHGASNAQAYGVLSSASGTIFNGSNALVQIIGTTVRNRESAYLRVPVENINNGTILVEQAVSDRNNVTLQLSGSGTFVNNGYIHLRIYGAGYYGDDYARIALISTDASQTSSILGTGRILLDMEDRETKYEGTAYIATTTASHVVTNGALHTIEGGGTISCSLVNLGLVRAIGTNGYLSVQNSPITEPFYGKAIINQASGKFVASDPSGMYIGTTGSAPSQFLNYGLLEARTGSFISFRKLTTTSTSKSTPATTMILEGTVAGGGQFINNFRPIQIASTATLAPGDLTNSDGTGDSTAGQLSFVTNLILNAATTLNFQLGRAETRGTDYDSVAVTGSLTLDGVLNLSALPDFVSSGDYTLFTCAPGGLIDNGLTISSVPTGSSRHKLTVDVDAGIVSIFFPSPLLLVIR